MQIGTVFLLITINITIPFNWINEVGNKVGNTVGNKPLNITRPKILPEIRNNRNITTKQLAVILGISETAVDKNLKFLKENGFIERKDSKKAGYWVVL